MTDQQLTLVKQMPAPMADSIEAQIQRYAAARAAQADTQERALRPPGQSPCGTDRKSRLNGPLLVRRNPDGSMVTDNGKGRRETRYPDGRLVLEIVEAGSHYRKETHADGSYREVVRTGQSQSISVFNSQTGTLTKHIDTPSEWTEQQFGPRGSQIYSKSLDKLTHVGQEMRPDPSSGRTVSQRFFEI